MVALGPLVIPTTGYCSLELELKQYKLGKGSFTASPCKGTEYNMISNVASSVYTSVLLCLANRFSFYMALWHQ